MTETPNNTNGDHRARIAAETKRVVVKLGTAVLTREDGRVALSRLFAFVESMAELRRSGREVLLVSSGAIGLGAARLAVEADPRSLALKQACAAVGQGRLMALYADAFDRCGIVAAQVLLTESDLSSRDRYLNLRSAIGKLLELGVVPVINENDTVSTDELRPLAVGATAKSRNVNFGDNDKLSALIAAKTEADLLLMLTDVDALYTGDPRAQSQVHPIPVVEKVTPAIEQLGGDPGAGRGGMRTKLEAARIATHSGCAVIVANGKLPGVIDRIFTGEPLGTLFLPQPGLSGKRRWIAFATTVNAALIVKDGARHALIEGKASLLPVGIAEVRGSFQRGDVVSIVDQAGVEFARGIVNYSSSEAREISGQRSEHVANLLDYGDELVTRNNIAFLTEGMHAPPA